MLALVLVASVIGPVGASEVCSADLHGSLALADRLYRDMVVYEREGRDDSADAQRSNLQHEIDVAQDEGGACRDRALLLQFHRLRALLLADRGTLNTVKMNDLGGRLLSHQPAGGGKSRWYSELQDEYRRSVSYGLETSFPRDAATIRAVLNRESPESDARNEVAYASHLKVATTGALSDLADFKQQQPGFGSHVLSVEVRMGDVYYYTFESAAWDSYVQSGRDQIYAAFEALAASSYAKVNEEKRAPIVQVVDESGHSLMSTVSGDHPPF